MLAVDGTVKFSFVRELESLNGNVYRPDKNRTVAFQVAVMETGVT